MTTVELYTTLQNDLVDEQRAMDRMDRDRDYDINYVNQKVKQYTKK
jgi:1,4-dihydroxy-2-naphthoate octaprenyltransferase